VRSGEPAGGIDLMGLGTEIGERRKGVIIAVPLHRPHDRQPALMTAVLDRR
jgi:hypothetical protein